MSSKACRKDLCWEYGERVSTSSTGKYCLKELTRFKHHLAGQRGNCTMDNFGSPLPEKMVDKLDEHNCVQSNMNGSPQWRDFSSTMRKCSMDNLGSPLTGRMVDKLDEPKFVQRDVNEEFDEDREDLEQYIARCFHECNIPPSAMNHPSFHEMVRAIREYGVGLIPPTPEELSGIYLSEAVNETRETLKTFKQNCKINGCSLMTNAWSAQKGHKLMSVVAHSRFGGMVFLDSFNASFKECSSEFINHLVDSAIEDVGEENVVQIVSDDVSNIMTEANCLARKRPHIFWTPCATHTINLMLAEIAEIKPIRSAIIMGRMVSAFIDSCTETSRLLEEYTGEREIVRPGFTHFATSFLSLQSIREKKLWLTLMFVSKEWDETDLLSTDAGKKVKEIILSLKFWDRVDLALRVFQPLVKVLRRVDGDQMSSMGFVYGCLGVAKAEIKEAFNDDEKKYVPIWSIIDKKWDEKLKTPLHKAGYYLNPYFYYQYKEEIENDASIKDGVTQCISKLYGNEPEVVMKLLKQLPMYQNEIGSFGSKSAKATLLRDEVQPATWWEMHGSTAVELRRMAVRILSLTSSSSVCDRNWCASDMTKMKKNVQDPQKLHDLVLVTYNLRLDTMSNIKKRDSLAVYYMEEGKTSEWSIPEVKTGGALVPLQDSDDEEAVPEVGKADMRSSQLGDRKRAKTAVASSSESKRMAEDEQEYSESSSVFKEEPNIVLVDGVTTSGSEHEDE